MGRLTLLYVQKISHYVCSKMKLWGTMHSIRLHIVSMGNLQGLEEINETCKKTVHMGAMDKTFTVPYFLNMQCIPVFKK